MSNKKYNFCKENKHRCLCRVCVKDSNEVAKLPYNWTARRGGYILANYLKERKENHIRATKNLEDSIVSINKTIELKIRDLAEMHLCNINNNQCDLDCVIKRHKSIDGPLSNNGRMEACSCIEGIISARLQDISEFKKRALKLEKERVDGLKKILHDNFRSALAVGDASPKDILKEFDDKMYQVNQQLLSNCSAYMELEMLLRAQADQSRRKALSVVNQLSLGVAVTQRGHGTLNRPSDDCIPRQRTQSADMEMSSDESSINEKSMNMESLNIIVTIVGNEYCRAIADLYEDFMNKLKDFISPTAYSNHKQNKDSCLEAIHFLDQKLRKIIRQFTKNIYYAIASVQSSWELTDRLKMAKKSLTSIGTELKNTYTLLHEASHLWDAHMVRVALAQKLTLAAVEELVSRHDSLELANEVTFNVTLEQMLTASDAVRLSQYYDALVKLLQEISDEYVKHSNAEIERLNEFMIVHIPLLNTVQDEFSLFISEHPVPTFLIINEDDNLNSARLAFTVKDKLSVEMYKAEVQAVALSNWRNGLLEKIENGTRLLTEKFERQIQLWISERSLPLIKRHSFKMMALEVRRERVAAARDSRLAEIRERERCLQSHLGAVDALAKTLPTELSRRITLDTPGLHPIRRWVNSIERGMKELQEAEVDVEVKTLKAVSYVTRLAKHRQLFDESLVPKIGSSENACEACVHEAKLSNYRFMSSLKLMNEGGRDSAAEAAETCSYLASCSHVLEHCAQSSARALQELRSEINAEVDKIISPLQDTAKAMLSETGKGTLRKNKLQRKRTAVL